MWELKTNYYFCIAINRANKSQYALDVICFSFVTCLNHFESKNVPNKPHSRFYLKFIMIDYCLIILRVLQKSANELQLISKMCVYISCLANEYRIYLRLAVGVITIGIFCFRYQTGDFHIKNPLIPCVFITEEIKALFS